MTLRKVYEEWLAELPTPLEDLVWRLKDKGIELHTRGDGDHVLCLHVTGLSGGERQRLLVKLLGLSEKQSKLLPDDLRIDADVWAMLLMRFLVDRMEEE